jgi:hypothetical protein
LAARQEPKVEDDYGMDFMFQVDLGHESRQASAITNTFAGACLRATASAKRVVTLSRGDAANLRNSRSPLVFVLVHVHGDPGQADVHHRLVDESRMGELLSFLPGLRRRTLT